MFRKLIVGLLAATMIGCAAVPESLRTDSENPITDVTALSDPAGQELGLAVRLGGVIAAVDNGEHQTRLEIVAMPIGRDAKPKLGSKTQRRFVAYVDGFLEPMEYHPGRLISVAGQVGGEEEGRVGEYLYRFPVVAASGTQLWQVKQEVWIDDFDRFRSCVGLYCSPSLINTGFSRAEVRERVTK
ncbi:starvation-inducible protein [Photobacterium gaetbulicola]|uniref:Starvation-inducible protein n=1 Tax=Photobacterium gaetbulicola TaxID=1295392 RepID=A0A0B9GDY1_9GAMM|nr:Slp family lipoprotein [Photobacterium gaetbulicola]KHT63025.1 starvation-inducible protein [Photobacterium gaetbulicola]